MGCRPRPTHSEEKVIGGRPAVAGELPAVVIYNANDGRCTGTMVTPYLMVTAHHCIRVSRSEDIVSPSLVTLDLKENQLPVGSKSVIQAGKIFVINSFELSQRYYVRIEYGHIMDLAIVRWTEPLPVPPIPFANWLPKAKDFAMFAGYGHRFAVKNPADDRLIEKHVGYNVIFEISNLDDVDPAEITVEGLIDARDEKNDNLPYNDASTAPGDSGGPLFVFKDGIPYLVGVTSTGLANPVLRQKSMFTHLLSEPSLKLLESVPELKDTAQKLRQAVSSQRSTQQEPTTK